MSSVDGRLLPSRWTPPFENTPASALFGEYARLGKELSYVFGGKDGYDMETALETLGNLFDIKSISLQGGGVIDSAMLAAGLIDELSLVIYPGIDGKSGIPSIFEYIGNADLPAQGQSLELKSVEQCPHGVVWLRYKIHKNHSV